MDKRTEAKYLTPEGLEAEYTVPRQTLANDRWKRRGIPFTRRGRRILYARADIEAFLEANRVTTTDAA